jgi:hypothetical protein
MMTLTPPAPPPRLVFVCRAENDLYRAICSGMKRRFARFDAADPALAAAPKGGSLLLLADGYPIARTAVPEGLAARASERGVRLFLEYPERGPGVRQGAAQTAGWRRAVVASEALPGLPKLRILGLHNFRYAPAAAERADLVAARVAGFDKALFGLPADAAPLLYADAETGTVVATTSLSHFASGRYAPTSAWEPLWQAIVARLQPGAAPVRLRWTPSVAPALGPGGPLPRSAELTALRLSAAWFRNSGMLLDADAARIYDGPAAAWPDRIGPAPPARATGDGSLGLLEGFNAAVEPDGAQPVRWWRRGDCNGEAAGALAMAGLALNDRELTEIGARVGDWYLARSIMAGGDRADPSHPAYGLLGWNDVKLYWGNLDGYGVYYGDDNARAILGMCLAASVLKTDRWDRRILQALFANDRITGPRGFQPDRVDQPDLVRQGWQAYKAAPTVSYSPHYQSYMWACRLWAATRTGHAPFLRVTEKAIREMMEAYPDRWAWVGSAQLERSRMLLCLAWLVRAEDTPEHRGWLRRMAGDLLAHMHPSGAILESLGAPANNLPPPGSNEAYGTAETPIIQTNDDAAADLLYACNFAFLGLHEAAGATRDPYYKEAEDRLAGFLCRAQTRSKAHPALNGVWFRAFDVGGWGYWASNADAGWGAWAVESGWTQTWISAVLAMRRRQTTLWDVTAGSKIGVHLAEVRAEMGGSETQERTQ